MKQGRSSHSGPGGYKVEPKPKAVNPAAPGQMGMAVQFGKETLFEGEGFKKDSPGRTVAGPGGGRTIHPSGSQGRHK
jgi:hypothetical protein